MKPTSIVFFLLFCACAIVLTPCAYAQGPAPEEADSVETKGHPVYLNTYNVIHTLYTDVFYISDLYAEMDAEVFAHMARLMKAEASTSAPFSFSIDLEEDRKARYTFLWLGMKSQDVQLNDSISLSMRPTITLNDSTEVDPEAIITPLETMVMLTNYHLASGQHRKQNKEDGESIVDDYLFKTWVIRSGVMQGGLLLSLYEEGRFAEINQDLFDGDETSSRSAFAAISAILDDRKAGREEKSLASYQMMQYYLLRNDLASAEQWHEDLLAHSKKLVDGKKADAEMVFLVERASKELQAMRAYQKIFATN